MSSTQPGHRKLKLTTLPPAILTRILRYLCPRNPFRSRTNRLKATHYFPFRDPSVTISLDYVKTMAVPLPTELISPALASPILAAAAATLLGDRVSFLTYPNTNGKLSNWVQAFAPYVKAICVNDSWLEFWRKQFVGKRRDIWMWPSLQELHQYIRIFKTISVYSVRLQVLDLMNVPFVAISTRDDDLMAALCTTLENSSATLRELAMPVYPHSYICDEALKMCSLKTLDVFSIRCMYDYDVDIPESVEPPFVRMIKAVDGHADRSRNLTTLRELRFEDVPFLEYNYMTPSDRECSVFSSVKALRVVMGNVQAIAPETPLFILLFKNLERLWWNFTPPSAGIMLKIVCDNVREVHLSPSRWFVDPIQVGASQHFQVECLSVGDSTSDTCFMDINGKKYWPNSIRTLSAGSATQLDLRNLITNCPHLENISVEATRENHRSIRKLVRKCRQLKCLELVIREIPYERLEDEDWRSISEIIPKSHENLCQVAIQDVKPASLPTTCLEAVFSCFETVAKTLGKRARRLAFRMTFRTSSHVRVMERIHRVANVCLASTPALESLEVIPYMNYLVASDCNRRREKVVFRRLRQAENQLISEIESLRMVDLGGSTDLWSHIDWNDSVKEDEFFGIK